jgi:SAM-dependent methyltransferase
MGVKQLLNAPQVYQKFQEAGGFFGARLTSIHDYLTFEEGQCVIDIGCGPGFLVDHLPTGIRYHGFDIDRTYIDYAQSHFSAKGSFYCGVFDAERAATVGPADIVMMNGLIHHLDQEAALATLRAARRGLKHDGTVFTLDGCFRVGQSPIASWLLRNDRGQFVRDENGYRALLGSVFHKVTIHIREDLSWVPYTFAVGLGRMGKAIHDRT